MVYIKKTVVIGSFRKHMKEIDAATLLFQHNNCHVMSPKVSGTLDEEKDFVVLETDLANTAKELQDGVLEKIENADFVYLVNPGGYVGKSAILEIGYATAKKIPIYAMELPSDVTIQYYIDQVIKPEKLCRQINKSLETVDSKFHIFFDADDTLWDDQERLQKYEISIEKLLNDKMNVESNFQKEFIKTEEKNIPKIGFGIHSYLFSLAETFYRNKEHYKQEDSFMNEVASLIKTYFYEPPAVFADVADTLLELRQRGYAIHLLTRATRLNLIEKINLADLFDYFDTINVVNMKNQQTYAKVLKKYKLSGKKCCMVGNSIKSDVKPALSAGFGAVHIPPKTPWQLESDTIKDKAPRYVSISKFSELLNIFQGDNIV